MWPNTPTSIWEMSSVGFQLREPRAYRFAPHAEGLFAEETVISSKNVQIFGKSNSNSVPPIIHICGLGVDVSHPEIAVRLRDAHLT
jgi:hypothetical protein